MTITEIKDFDTLVQEVNTHLLAFEQQKSDFKTKVKKTMFSILEWIQSMNLFWNMEYSPNYNAYLWLDTSTLQAHQIDAICLASDRVRAFEKTKQQFEQEKIGKDTEIVQKIEDELMAAEVVYKRLYEHYKKNFNRK